MNTAVMFSSAKDDWQTPPELFAQLHAEFRFTTDAACTPFNALCAWQIFDALEMPWSDDGDYTHARVFVNPPYSRGLQGKFIAKAAEEARNGALVVMLLPARTDTKAFHAHIWDAEKHQPRAGVEVRFLPGRLKFVGAKHGAPFPSMVVIFRGQR
jgi:phage N-6-adenine-methyltransferase